MLKFIVIFICPALDEIPFLSKFVQNIKILCLRQNLILRQIRICWISLEIPFLCKFDTDRQVCLITMKLGVYTDSNKELCWNFLFRTGNTSKFDPKGQNCLIKFNVEFEWCSNFLFGQEIDKFVPKRQNCLIEMKLDD